MVSQAVFAAEAMEGQLVDVSLDRAYVVGETFLRRVSDSRCYS